MMAGLSIVVNFYMATHKHDCKGAVTPDNVSCNLSRNFVVTQVARKIALCNIPCKPATDMSRNYFVAAIVAKSRIRFYFSQRLRQRYRNISMRCLGVFTPGNVSCNSSRNGATKLQTGCTKRCLV